MDVSSLCPAIAVFLKFQSAGDTTVLLEAWTP